MKTEPQRKDQKHPLCYDPRCDIHTTPKTNVALKSMFPRASQAFLDANQQSLAVRGSTLTKNAIQPIVERKKAKHETNHQRKIQDSEPQRHETPALDSANEGKTKSLGRTRVSFIGMRVRPLDPDNFAGSVKDLLDGLRHAHILQGDEWWRITLETRQVKVKSYAEERTEIQIDL